MKTLGGSFPSPEGSVAEQIPISPCNVARESGVGGYLLGQEGDAEQSEEAREGRATLPPKAPSAEEMRIHRLTQYPSRSCCPVCVAARAKNWPHLRMEESGSTDVPTICFDYCFLRDTVGGESIPVLVGREKGTKFLVAHVVPFNGARADWLVCYLVRDLRKWGSMERSS